MEQFPVIMYPALLIQLLQGSESQVHGGASQVRLLGGELGAASRRLGVVRKRGSEQMGGTS